jgi:hypothetical protein
MQIRFANPDYNILKGILNKPLIFCVYVIHANPINWWRYWFNADSFEKAGKNFLIDFYNFFYHFSLNSDLTKIVNSMRINQNWY